MNEARKVGLRRTLIRTEYERGAGGPSLVCQFAVGGCNSHGVCFFQNPDTILALNCKAPIRRGTAELELPGFFIFEMFFVSGLRTVSGLRSAT